MKLLLLLSALLSALGGTAGARAAQVPVALSASIATVAKAAVGERAIASRPVQSFARPGYVAIVMPAALVLAPATPAFASRRRE